jgi:hypothetical protein
MVKKEEKCVCVVVVDVVDAAYCIVETAIVYFIFILLIEWNE